MTKFSKEELIKISDYLDAYANHLGPSKGFVKEIEDLCNQLAMLADKAYKMSRESKD